MADINLFYRLLEHIRQDSPDDYEKLKALKGGAGSGNFGHLGLSGRHGGSRSGGGLAGLGLSSDSTLVERRLASANAAIDRDITSFLDNLETFGDSRPERDILPTGRAERGQGQEFATRRWINERMDTLVSRQSRLQQQVRRNRGTRRDRRDSTRASINLNAVNEAIQVSRHMISNLQQAGIPFADARDLFNDIFNYPTALTGGVR